jgi:DNA-binding Xre family transcriptional regulator
MRLRLTELMAASKDIKTPYAVASASSKRISLSTIYRLNRSNGVVANFDAELLEALCDVFRVEPGELLERTAQVKQSKRAKRAKKGARG